MGSANPSLDVMRRAAKALREIIEEPEGALLSPADAEALPGVIEALGFALTDWLKEAAVHSRGTSYAAITVPPGRQEMTEAARALAVAGRNNARQRMPRGLR